MALYKSVVRALCIFMLIFLGTAGYDLYHTPRDEVLDNIRINTLIYKTAVQSMISKQKPSEQDYYFTEENSYSYSFDVSELEDKEINPELIEEYIFRMTNQLRYDKGLHILGRNDDLDTVARYYADYLSDRNKGMNIDHVDDLGRDPAGRAEDLGIKTTKVKGDLVYKGIGENIAWFTQEYAKVTCTQNSLSLYTSKTIARCSMNGWIESPGHYANLVSEAYDEIGVGVALGDSGFYLVQNFR